MDNYIEILKVNGQKVGEFRDPSKAPKNTTLAGYGITDAYTKEETNNILMSMSTIVSNLRDDLTNYYRKNQTYSKDEVNNLLSTIEDFEPVVVEASNWPLPSGEDKKIYLVNSQDGESYSEYIWTNNAFAPLATHTGNISIDNFPLPESDALVRSGGVYDNIRKKEKLNVGNKSGWTALSTPLSGYVVIENRGTLAGNVQFATTVPDAVNTNVNVRVSRTRFIIVYLPDVYRYYATTAENVFVYNIDLQDICPFSQDNVRYLSNWSAGYINNNLEFVEGTNLHFLYTTIDVVPGAYYLLPYSDNDGFVPLVSLNQDGTVNGPLKKTTGVAEAVYNGFTIVQAKTSKIGITVYFAFEMLGNNIAHDDVCKLPYVDYSSLGGLLNKESINQLMNVMSMLNFKMSYIDNIYNGFYDANKQILETETYGDWKYSIIDTEPGEWYIINSAVFKNIRIFDQDDNDNVSANNSVPDSYYNLASSSKLSWVLVKAKYKKLGVCFIDPTTVIKDDDKNYPRYCKLSRDDNNGLLLLFLEFYNSNSSKGGTITVRKSGGADYTSLTEAILDNIDNWGVKIHIDEGEYDIIQELTEYYGTEEFVFQTKQHRGIELYHDIVLEGSPNAIIKANYHGNIERMKNGFSVFNIDASNNVGGATLRGLNIQASNIRYVIHDEKREGTTGSYTNVYENCSMKMDNSQNDIWKNIACIGGGLGMSGSIIIRNCIFESVRFNTMWESEPVQYHNNKNTGAKSIISCTDNYIKGDSTFRFTWYGQSTDKTQIICAGNNVGKSLVIKQETTDGTSSIENIEVLQWNNVIRN